MRKVILTFGFIAGIIMAIMVVASTMLWHKGYIDFENSTLVGYTTMIISLSMIFFGIKSYRDNHNNGHVKFWTAVKIGLLIASIASVMYAITWDIYYNNSDLKDTFFDKYATYEINKLQKSGAPESEIIATKEQMSDFKNMYSNTVFRFGMTLLEIFPVGILITFISAAILRKKEVLPAFSA